MITVFLLCVCFCLILSAMGACWKGLSHTGNAINGIFDILEEVEKCLTINGRQNNLLNSRLDSQMRVIQSQTAIIAKLEAAQKRKKK